MLDWIAKKAKAKEQIEDIQNTARQMFPDPSFTNAAMRIQHGLDAGQLTPDQYRWHTDEQGNRDILPWQLSPNHFYDLVSTQEGLNQEGVNQLYQDYWHMNNLPPALNNMKNIDILIEAASKEDTPY
tara:strand:- start:4507 stop:4887 length:381 start_codon:yes stop_codon:yes gene_type:complete